MRIMTGAVVHVAHGLKATRCKMLPQFHFQLQHWLCTTFALHLHRLCATFVLRLQCICTAFAALQFRLNLHCVYSAFALLLQFRLNCTGLQFLALWDSVALFHPLNYIRLRECKLFKRWTKIQIHITLTKSECTLVEECKTRKTMPCTIPWSDAFNCNEKSQWRMKYLLCADVECNKLVKLWRCEGWSLC